MKHKYFAAILVLAILCSTIPAFARGGGWGLGIILGEPTGISFKTWTGRTTAIDAAAAWSFKDQGKLHVHFDFLTHNFRILRVDRGQLPIYYGIGGRVKFEEDIRAGVRIPVGIAYIFEGQPLDLFFEFVPLLDLAPETQFNFNASVGVRYFFNRQYLIASRGRR